VGSDALKGERWFEPLRPACRKACLAARLAYPPDVVLFYVARWCQKETKSAVPDLDSLDETDVHDAAQKIASNLAHDGATVERLLSADRDALAELWRELFASAALRAPAWASDFADEGRQKILEILLTGTRPSEAVAELRSGPEGPGNEYVFVSPFSYWAKTVVKNLVRDKQREIAREYEGPPAPPRRKRRTLDRALLRQALAELPDLLEAIRELPPMQRRVMTASLVRCEVDELVRERLLELAPDLFSEFAESRFSSDRDIADHLGSTPRRVASNRSEARRKLVNGEPLWKLLLDALLPHRSTGPRSAARKGGGRRAAASVSRSEA
jgi:hypothetical protein